MAAHDISPHEQLSHTVSEDKTESYDHHPSPLIIPKNRSTGDLLGAALTTSPEHGRSRPSLAGRGAGSNIRSPLVQDHEHGMPTSGLRRIRLHQPASRAPSRAPTVPSSPTTSFMAPPRTGSITLDSLTAHRRGSSPTGLPSPPVFTEDLTLFPSESLHSFSFAHQSEDALHNRQALLNRALEFVRDRLGAGSHHPSVLSAQAKISGDAEIVGMVELLTRANLLGRDALNVERSEMRPFHSLAGPMTGPVDMVGKNAFDEAFMNFGASSDTSVDDLDIKPSPSQTGPSSTGSLEPTEKAEQPPQRSPDRPMLKRTLTDVSLLDLQSRLVDALARPYSTANGAIDNHLAPPAGLPPPQLPASSIGLTPASANPPSTPHPHRWVPAAQAIFTTESASPWTILAANDLACLVFGVQKAEIRKMSVLELIREDKRRLLERRLELLSADFALQRPRRGPSQTNSAASSRTPSASAMGSGITASLLGKPSWRSQRSPSDNGYRNSTNKKPKFGSMPSNGVLLCGDIFPIQKRNGAAGAASLWVKEKCGSLIWVLEEIQEDVALLKLDEDAIVLSADGAAASIWGSTKDCTGRPVTDLVPALPLIDGFAVDKTALEQDEDSKCLTAKRMSGAGVPIMVSMDPVNCTLRVCSLPHIAGIVVLSQSDLSIINANSVFSGALFGLEDLCGMNITDLLPKFDDIIEFLTEEEKIALVDGIVVPEHSFRRARALLAVREGTSDAATIFLRPQGLVAKHRDGSEINVDIQMRVVRNERGGIDDAFIQEEERGITSGAGSPIERAEIVYALWITYSRQMHSASTSGRIVTPSLSRPGSPLHQPSPGQTARALSPMEIESEEPSDIESTNTRSPSLSQKLEEAASQPISDGFVEMAPITPSGASSHTKSSSRVRKDIADFLILEDMGQGAYGQVKLARYTKGVGGKVVLKYVTKKRILVDTWTRDRRLGTVPLEIHVMEYLRRDGLRHPNIVEMIDFFEDDVNYYIEMVPHGLPGMDLFDYIEMRTTMDELECRNIFLQVVAALHHLHEKARVVHRDIKDENIILDGEGKVKLIDFGSAAYVKNGPFDVFVGTIDYAAPEVLQGKSYRGKEQDIWALGILLYTLVYKENPFYSIDEILDHELRIPWIMSHDNIDLIQAMLDRDVERRVDINQVLAHRWCTADLSPGAGAGGAEEGGAPEHHGS